VPASEDPEGAEFTTIKLSAIFNVVLLTVVVVPEIVKFPPIVVFPPTKRLPAMPLPPETTRAPVVVLVLAVVPVTFTLRPDKTLTVTCPDTPTPPVTTSDPDPTDVLAVPPVKDTTLLTPSVPVMVVPPAVNVPDVTTFPTVI